MLRYITLLLFNLWITNFHNLKVLVNNGTFVWSANSGASEQLYPEIIEHIEKEVLSNLIVNYTIAYDILKNLQLVLSLFRNRVLNITGFYTHSF